MRAHELLAKSGDTRGALPFCFMWLWMVGALSMVTALSCGSSGDSSKDAPAPASQGEPELELGASHPNACTQGHCRIENPFAPGTTTCKIACETPTFTLYPPCLNHPTQFCDCSQDACYRGCGKYSCRVGSVACETWCGKNAGLHWDPPCDNFRTPQQYCDCNPGVIPNQCIERTCNEQTCLVGKVSCEAWCGKNAHLDQDPKCDNFTSPQEYCECNVVGKNDCTTKCDKYSCRVGSGSCEQWCKTSYDGTAPVCENFATPPHYCQCQGGLHPNECSTECSPETCKVGTESCEQWCGKNEHQDWDPPCDNFKSPQQYCECNDIGQNGCTEECSIYTCEVSPGLSCDNYCHVNDFTVNCRNFPGHVCDCGGFFGYECTTP